MFDGTRGKTFGDVTDGTSNTVMIVTARDAIPWTRPGDLPSAQGNPLQGLDDADSMGVLVGMADGSARSVPRGDASLWKKLITPAGGEVLVWPSLPERMPQNAHRAPKVEMLPTPAPSPPTQVTINTGPASPISPDLDARLRAIEAKLDRLLRK